MFVFWTNMVWDWTCSPTNLYFWTPLLLSFNEYIFNINYTFIYCSQLIYSVIFLMTRGNRMIILLLWIVIFMVLFILKWESVYISLDKNLKIIYFRYILIHYFIIKVKLLLKILNHDAKTFNTWVKKPKL